MGREKEREEVRSEIDSLRREIDAARRVETRQSPWELAFVVATTCGIVALLLLWREPSLLRTVLSVSILLCCAAWQLWTALVECRLKIRELGKLRDEYPRHAGVYERQIGRRRRLQRSSLAFFVLTVGLLAFASWDALVS